MMKYLLRMAMLLLLTLGLGAYTANAATCRTTADGNFSDPSIWDCGNVPVNGDIVIIDNDVILDQDYTTDGTKFVYGFTINDGASLIDNDGTHTLIVGDGGGGSTLALNISGYMEVGYLSLVDADSFIASTGYVLVVDDMILDKGAIDFGGTGAVVEVTNDLDITNGCGTDAFTGEGVLAFGCLTPGSCAKSEATVTICQDSETTCARVGGTVPCTPILLPIELVDFYGELLFEGAVLRWATASEKNNEYFVIEKSYDGISFEPIAKVDGAGHSKELMNYEYVDGYIKQTADKVYYRLKQVDYDGMYAYSWVVRMLKTNTNQSGGQAVNISRNSNYLEITWQKAYTQLKIYNVLGEIISHKELNTQQISTDIEVGNYQSGVYFIQMIDQFGKMSRQKFWLQN